MNILKWVTFSLVLIGAINWGLVGAFGFDLVAFMFGEMTILTRIIYSLVGLAGVTYLFLALGHINECSHYNC